MGFLSNFLFLRTGTIKYQVKFYISKYASLLQQGFSKEDAIKWLMEFYLQGESYDRKKFMESNFDTYVTNIDILISTITIYYFHYDDPKHYSIEDILSDTIHYLLKYKRRYNVH
jgi:hypothetical protein